ncbi:MAG: ComEC/Rec2 family competence protein [Candidatus Omnitrophota bacterium]
MEKPRIPCCSSFSVLSVCFACGIGLSAFLGLGPVLSGCLSLAAGVLCAATLGRARAFVFCLLFWALALGSHAGAVRSQKDYRGTGFFAAGSARIKGVLASDPFEEGQKGFLLKTSALCQGGRCVPVHGKLWVKAKKSVLFCAQNFSYGDKLDISGSLTPPNSFYERFLSSRGAMAILYAREIKKEGWDKSLALGRYAFFLRRVLASSLRRHHGEAAASVLEAMLLGLKSRMPKDVKGQAIRAGTWHIFVVSGSHVGVVAFIASLCFKVLRVRGRRRLGLVLVCVWLYCLICGSSAPVLRATIMVTFFLFSFFWQRNPLYLHNLSLAALTILILDPAALFSVGFQLSFLSVFFIAWLYPRLDFSHFFKRHRSIPSFLRIPCLFMARGFGVSLCAWLGTAPLFACVFGHISLSALAANIAILPLSGVIMASGFAYLCLAWTPLAGWLAQSDEGLLVVFLAVNRYFSGLRGGYFSGLRLPLAAAWAAYAILVLGVWAQALFKKR